ncbi:MAG: arylsulfatase [Gammaproteobacteria bacterium]|nr:arylsulfatase [Gammaproteobacteria bacterium]
MLSLLVGCGGAEDGSGGRSAAVESPTRQPGAQQPESQPRPGGPDGEGAASREPGGVPGAGARPNIVLIVADDLGYSDLGAFGGEIPTPNIDALARDGMMLTQFYSSLACSPTRSMLFSGTDNHVAGLGVMGPPQDPKLRGQPGYEAHLNFRVASLASLMRDAGYRTYMTGKWHLGRDVETGPAARGFDRSFVSLDGAAHLGGLSWNGPGLAPYRDGEELVTVGEDFYSTRFYTQRMIEYIESDRGGAAAAERAAGSGGAEDDAPFFAYLAYTAPHWPLQAPRESIAKFEGWYDEGYEALYRRRLERAKELGLVPADFEGIPPVDGQPSWEELTDEERRFAARRMEIYAAMVSDLDAYVGRFVDYLEEIGELDDTFIFFMSDNGPESSRRELVPPVSRWVETCCDNSYENLGAGDSYVMYGPNWARAGSAPFRRWKATAFEGGIHVPAFARFPGVVPEGGRNDAFATVMDLLPTFLALAGAEHPGETYRGRPVAPVRGESLLPMLSGRAQDAHDEEYYVGWELYGHRAVRQGNWKIVWDPTEREAAAWHLFDLSRDPGEQSDLAAAEPERLERMLELWERYRRDSGVIL